MNNFLNIILLFVIITSCSLHKNSKFWTNEKIVEEKKENSSKIFEKEKTLVKELNSKLKISLYTKAINGSFINNFDKIMVESISVVILKINLNLSFLK